MPSASSAKMNDLPMEYIHRVDMFTHCIRFCNDGSQKHVYCSTNAFQIKSIYELLAIKPLSATTIVALISRGPPNANMYLSSAVSTIYIFPLSSSDRQSSLFLISFSWCSRLDFMALISHIRCIFVYKTDINTSIWSISSVIRHDLKR